MYRRQPEQTHSMWVAEPSPEVVTWAKQICIACETLLRAQPAILHTTSITYTRPESQGDVVQIAALSARIAKAYSLHHLVQMGAQSLTVRFSRLPIPNDFGSIVRGFSDDEGTR